MGVIYKELEGENVKVRIEYEEYPESPDFYDRLGTIYYTENRYFGFGKEDKGFNYSEDLAEKHRELEKAGAIILPVYAHVHSGVSVSTGSFSDPWDSGQCGFIAVERGRVLEEYGKKIITKKVRETVVRVLEGEIETWDQYFTGEIFGIIVTDNDGEELESCWGFYGYKYTEEEADRQLKAWDRDVANEKTEEDVMGNCESMTALLHATV